MCTTYIPGAHGNQKRFIGSPEIEIRWFRVIVLWVLGATKATTALNY